MRRPEVAHGDADAGQPTPRSTFYDTGRFGRLFPALPPFSADVPLIRDALSELGAAGGPMDAQDDLSDPVTLITDPAKSAHNPNNPALTAGFTFLGQFLDHDMTFDPTSSLARAQDPESIRNFRIPALDLDSVYGGGPACVSLPVRPGRGRRTDYLPDRGDPRVGCRFRRRQHAAGPAPQQPVGRADRRSAQRREHDGGRAAAGAAPFPQPGLSRCGGRPGHRVHGGRDSSPRPSGWCAGTTSGWCCTNSCPEPWARRRRRTSWTTA